MTANVHCTLAKGKAYYSFHPFRGTSRSGKRVRLLGEPANEDGTPNQEWWAAYRQLAGLGVAKTGAGTFKALIAEYQQSPEWQTLALPTRKEWSRHLRLIALSWGDLQVAGVEPKHVVKLRDSRASTPADAARCSKLARGQGACASSPWKTSCPKCSRA